MCDLKLSPRTKFRANACNSNQVMADKPNLEWRPPPFWIYFRYQFWSRDLFPVMAGYIPAKLTSYIFHKCKTIGVKVLTPISSRLNISITVPDRRDSHHWPPIGNTPWGVGWSRDRWRHVSPKVKVVTAIYPRLNISITVPDRRMVTIDRL